MIYNVFGGTLNLSQLNSWGTVFLCCLVLSCSTCVAMLSSLLLIM